MKTSKKLTTIAALTLTLALSGVPTSTSAAVAWYGRIQSQQAHVACPAHPITEGGARRMLRSLRIRLLQALGYSHAFLMRNWQQVALLAQYGADGVSVAEILAMEAEQAAAEDASEQLEGCFNP